MIAASVGGTIASDLGFSTAFAEEGTAELGTLSFGILEPLVEVMRDTPPDKLQALLVGKLRRGETTLKDMTAAGALANARTFGGVDYDGFHCMFALVPALETSAELPEQERTLPALKVLYRNTARMQSVCAKDPRDVLRPVTPAALPPNANVGELIRKASRNSDVTLADRLVVALAQRSPKEALQALQVVVQDRPNVHSVALTHRAWEVIDLIGEEHLEKFDGKILGSSKADDAWVAKAGHVIYGSSRRTGRRCPSRRHCTRNRGRSHRACRQRDCPAPDRRPHPWGTLQAFTPWMP